MSTTTTHLSFSACNTIADFYRSMPTTKSVTEGPFGGKAFSWIVITKAGQRYTVACCCHPLTLGIGILRIQSTTTNNTHFFVRPPIVNQLTGEVMRNLSFGGLLSKIQLPTAN